MYLDRTAETTCDNVNTRPLLASQTKRWISLQISTNWILHLLVALIAFQIYPASRYVFDWQECQVPKDDIQSTSPRRVRQPLYTASSRISLNYLL
jgi:hypothetical protein